MTHHCCPPFRAAIVGLPRQGRRGVGGRCIAIALTSVVLLTACIRAESEAGAPANQDEVRFNRDIRPILAEHCWACHGHDANQRQADLRLDERASALEDHGSGPAIVPGASDQSALVERITADDPELVMPPRETRKPLSADQIALLQRWIDQGAPYEGHWAYAPIQRPDVPKTSREASTMAITSVTGVHPIDAFVQRALEARGLQPAPRADARTLVRRLYLDLHGLPPSQDAITSLEQSNSPAAYLRLVDELLASPRFAERMAIAWLDAVRYADTTGFHGDQEISMWPYRDYVLRAFHENKPFDQFTREQLAGDLLPGATSEQVVASAFNRLNRMSTEGGVQDREYLAKYAADRVRTIGMVWMGSTMGCCECHDHKYDPFTMRDFYSLAAFFADIQEHGFYPNGFDRGDWGPRIELPTAEQQAKRDALRAELASIEQRLAAFPDDEVTLAARDQWIEQQRTLATANQLGWQPQKPLQAASEQGAMLTVQPDGLIVASGPNPDQDTYTIEFRPGSGVWTGLRLSTETSEDLPGNRVGRGWRSFAITDASVWLADDRRPPERVLLSTATANRDSARYPAGAAIDPDSASAWAVEHGHSGNHRLTVQFAAPLATDEQSVVIVRLAQQSSHRQATLGRFRLALSRALPVPNEDVPQQALLDALQAVEPTDEQRQLLADTYRQIDPQREPLRTAQARLRTGLSLLEGQFDSVLVSKANEPRTMRVLPRGNWMDESGSEVAANTPEHLPALGVAGRRATRLDLANWLVREDQPLTARVIANRMWQHFFGAGLARVPEDLGSQGHWPSHPELLDWLASEFQSPEYDAAGTHGWDFKHLVRQIVLSQTYQQSSQGSSAAVEADPQNLWLSRQVPLRLDAETIRDQALAAAGMLHERFGGPSIRPAQPSGHWLPLNYPKREYDQSLGEDQYGRSLYMHWQRTFLHPALATFDASTREECQVSRMPSNTPLQALVLLNDPIFVEAARGLAQRTLREGPSDDVGRIGYLGRLVLGRDWTDDELPTLQQLLTDERTAFRDQPADARALVSIGEWPPLREQSIPEIAAWTVVARAVLNLHETITRN